ncbi:MarR family winged helix-turn-helix transcriptional regulator [Eilatimonas milleporae]|uniref:DNA-binding MarR family transcriptional regulator n=1 Tax=Eilatimonas milleporae TaxID=911205 RepID=A0A3M0CPD2_9PROT|nr:MarR family winged helix-turn-helix transcriptional regulator [Eilatimonas milleporae]RMB08739.1 DNA-binding MarR family transcriptional regulator [Eilatimonas milleporae]
MAYDHQPGLGELLRHLIDLVDGGTQSVYGKMGLDYRPRYTPLMRGIGRGQSTVTDITAAVQITQGAVSRTAKLMEADGIIHRETGEDSRSSVLRLTEKGLMLLDRLERHWEDTFTAIEDLETEINHPLRDTLTSAISALEADGFSQRLTRVMERRHDRENP